MNEFNNIKPKGFEILRNNIKKEDKMNEVNVTEKPELEFGIEETKDVVISITEFSNALIKILNSGKLKLLTVLFYLFKPLKTLPAAISNIDKVPLEIKDISVDELNQLAVIVKERLEIKSDDVYKVIQEAITTGHQIKKFVDVLKDAIDDTKKI